MLWSISFSISQVMLGYSVVTDNPKYLKSLKWLISQSHKVYCWSWPLPGNCPWLHPISPPTCMISIGEKTWRNTKQSLSTCTRGDLHLFHSHLSDKNITWNVHLQRRGKYNFLQGHWRAALVATTATLLPNIRSFVAVWFFYLFKYYFTLSLKPQLCLQIVSVVMSRCLGLKVLEWINVWNIRLTNLVLLILWHKLLFESYPPDMILQI